MKKTNSKASSPDNTKYDIFSDCYRMETETVYHPDGRISTYPCVYELGQQITSDGSTVSYKGRITVDPDGQLRVTPYAEGSHLRYLPLYRTRHGEVKETRHDLIVKLQFPKRLGPMRISDLLEDETDDICAYIEG